MPQSLKRFLSNFSVVAIQNSLDVFRNTLYVRNNSKTSRWFPFIKSVTISNWFLAALSEHTCLTNHTIRWDNSQVITTNRRYHQQRLCLEAWHINSAHATLNRDGGGLLPDAYLHIVRKKGR